PGSSLLEDAIRWPGNGLNVVSCSAFAVERKSSRFYTEATKAGFKKTMMFEVSAKVEMQIVQGAGQKGFFASGNGPDSCIYPKTVDGVGRNANDVDSGLRDQ